MSATNRGAKRMDHDCYPTPNWVTEAIAAKVNWSRVDRACEPCEGDRDIINSLTGYYGAGPWLTFEIRAGRDYLEPDQEWDPVELCITNPPYGLAAEFLRRALEHSACVLFLLRLNFLGSEDRKELLRANRPTHLYTLSRRPSFVDVCDGFPNPDKTKRVKGCGMAFQKADAVKVCPACGGRVKAGTDATEYAWFAWDRRNIMRDAPGIYVL